MKIAIVYKSLTGNTELLAKNIKEYLNDEDVVYFGKPNENVDADLYFVGSWTDKGNCDNDIAKFLSKLENKKIAYFGTAGFGGSLSYYETLFERVKSIIPDSNIVLDYFFCQGKMPMRTRERYVQMIKENPNDKKLEVSLKNFDEALNHPDSNDINNLNEWLKRIL